MERDFKWIWIPKEIWLNKELTIQEKIFFVEIDSLDNDKWCYASNKYFADFFWISTTRVSLVIKSLITKWFVKSNIIYKEGTQEILKRVLNICYIPPFNICYIPPLTFIKDPIQQKLKDNNTFNNTENNTKTVVEDFSSITSKEIKTPVSSLKHWTKTIRDLLSILVEKKIMSEQNFSKLNLKEIEEYFIEHALIHLSGFKKKLPATMPDELMTDEEYFKVFDCWRTIIESRMVLYYWDDRKEELKRRRKEFDEQTEATWYDWSDLLFSKIETMIDWCVRSNREIKNLKTTFLTFIKPKKFK